MQLSKYNIVSRIKNSDEYFIVNALYGTADIIDADTCKGLFEGHIKGEEFVERGYLVDPEAEKKHFRQAYLKFLDDRENDELQLFFIPGYECNFNCSYCYQADYEGIDRPFPGYEVVRAFFSYVDACFSGRRKYITLFGGEPLLPGSGRKAFLERFFADASIRDIPVSIVTNGYHIGDYIEVLKNSGVREIQVTLDGTGKIHNKRRRHKNGKATFGRIVRGVDLLLANRIPVNLRVVIDRENINNLPSLAGFAIQRGWTRSELFTTQLGRNYELHGCQADSSRLYSRLEMYAGLYRLINEYPHITEFHRPSFSVSRHLYETGEMPSPLFDSCPGTKTEWAFDSAGAIYACTATAGKRGEELGRFFPERVIFSDKIDDWTERDILSIKKCRDCNLSLLCGGGCAAVAKNSGGTILDPDCRPVRELLELGISAYFGDQCKRSCLNQHDGKTLNTPKNERNYFG
jgi:uncharacterized protein